MARELRRKLGPSVHVKVTFDAGPPPPSPEQQVPAKPPTFAEAFASTSAFFRHRQ
jgi:hypothetical protein